MNFRRMLRQCSLSLFLGLLLGGVLSCVDEPRYEPKVEPEVNNDKQALIALYDAMNGAQWIHNEGWKSDMPLSKWYGVRVDTVKGAERVVEIGLNENNLKGEFPISFFDLPYLKVFNMGGNAITGTLPEQIGNLKSLTDLHLYGNMIKGKLPVNIASLENLVALNLSSNQFEGSIPAEYAVLFDQMPSEYPFGEENILKIHSLLLRVNRLSGDLPPSLYNHPKWCEFWANIMACQTGLALKMPPTKLYNYDKIVFTDLNGNSFKLKERVSKHKYTVLAFWNTSSSLTQKMAQLNSIMNYLNNNFREKGVDVIGVNWQKLYSKFDVQEVDQVQDYVKSKNQQWTQVAGNYPGNWISYLCLAIGDVSVTVLDNDGNIVFASNIINTTFSGVLDFIEKRMGAVNDYESTDYSLDGTWEKIQSATDGRDREGVNFVITGDGFTDKEMEQGGKFDQYVGYTLEGLFDTEPMRSYRSYINVYKLRSVSKHEGIGNGRETAYSSSIEDGGVAITGNDEKIISRVTSIRDINNMVVVVVLNTPKYAGTCHMYPDEMDPTNVYTIAYSTYIDGIKDSFLRVLRHESIGHGFGLLMDEYCYYDEEIPLEYKNTIISEQKLGLWLNVTFEKDKLPWQYLIGLNGYEKVGAYEGSYYFNYGIWRSEEISCMGDNRPYFNAVSRELIVKRIKHLVGEGYSFQEFLEKDKVALQDGLHSRGFEMSVGEGVKPLGRPVVHKLKK